MNILYIANLGDNKASGVNIVVPQHMKFQSKYANIGFYNFRNISMPIDPSVQVLSSSENTEFNLAKLPDPFNHPDLVVFHDIFSCLKFCKVAKKLYKMSIPYVIVPHGSFTHNAIKRRRTKKIVALHTILRTLVYKSNAVQYLTEDELNNSYVKNKSIIIPNGTIIPKKLNLKGKRTNNISFVSIGRKDIYHKGIDLLLEACEVAADVFRKNGATLTLYGPDLNGSFAKINKMISDFNISDFVFNKDGIFGQEKERVLKSESVFVLTSRLEGQPLSLLEACAYELPVLVTPGTNVSKEVLDFECGWVASQSKESIADKMTYIINHPQEIEKCSKNAYDYVSGMYSWEKVAAKTIEEYKALINH